MKKNLLLVAVLLAIAFTAYLIVSQSDRAVGSIDFDIGAYVATSTSTGFGNNKQCIVLPGRILGSVVVTLTSNAPLYIYDATTTGPHSDHATTTIAAFKTTAAGNYTFDVATTRGICVVGGESTVGVASTTITFK